MMTNKKSILIVLLGWVVLLAACGSDSPAEPVVKPGPPQPLATGDVTLFVTTANRSQDFARKSLAFGTKDNLSPTTVQLLPGVRYQTMDGFGAATVDANGTLVVSTMSGSVQTFDDATGRWNLVGQLQNPRFFHRMAPIDGKKLLVVGGSNMSTGKIEAVETVTLP